MCLGPVGFCDNYDDISGLIRRWGGVDVTRCIGIWEVHGSNIGRDVSYNE
jgi:hypothetical protein